jgi:hypothetical protein
LLEGNATTCGDRIRESDQAYLLSTPETGYGEVKQRPELQLVILDRRSRKNEAVGGNHPLHSLRKLCLRVLDDVTFIKNAVVAVELRDLLNVVPANVVGSDDNLN